MFRALVVPCLMLVCAACGDDGTESSDAGGTSHPLDGGRGAKDSGRPSTDGGPQNNATAAETCVDTINEYRATLGLSPYARWTDAESCTSDAAKSDSETGKAHGAFGKCGEMAQNECPGWPGPPEKMIPDCLAMMWDEGPGEDFSKHGHYINMSSDKYTKVACGFYTLPNGDVWAVQNFR
jgi:hypothetical protein